MVDTRTGDTVGMLRFQGAVQEIFDVKVLPGITWPTIVTDPDILRSTFVLPPENLQRIARPEGH